MYNRLPEVINHPDKAPIFLVREDFIHICQDAPDPKAAGFILSLFEYWTRVKKAKHVPVEMANSFTEHPTQDTSLWVYKTEKDLKDETLGLFGDKKLRANREWLIEQGFLLKRNNPKVPGDRTLQYHLGFKAIQKVLDGMNYASDHGAELPDDGADLPHDPAEMPDDGAEMPEQYQRLPTETTPETTHTDQSIAADAARPPAAGDLKEKPSSGGRTDRDQHSKGIPPGAEDTGIEPPTALGKFIVGVNGKTTKLTLAQADQIDTFYDVYFDGEVKRINPSTLYDEDPYFREYCKKIAADLQRQQQSGKRRLPPSRDRLIKFLTTNKKTGLDVFFKWREDRIHQERADAYSRVDYEGDVYVDPRRAAFEAELQAILKGEDTDEQDPEHS